MNTNILKPHHNSTATPTAEAAQPWWKYPLVWMIIAGPTIVVIAGFITLWLAIQQPDPVVVEDYYRRGVEINKELNKAPHKEAAKPSHTLSPAMSGRNHAATPEKDSPLVQEHK